MARTEEEMYRMIAILTNLSIYTGLRIYKKTSIIIFNKREQLHHIKNIKVAKKVKYLGITLGNKKICFKIRKENSIQKAKKLVNVTYPVITQSCNRILIEKTSLGFVLRTVLYASSILAYTKDEIEKLQRTENSVY